MRSKDQSLIRGLDGRGWTKHEGFVGGIAGNIFKMSGNKHKIAGVQMGVDLRLCVCMRGMCVYVTQLVTKIKNQNVV